MHVVGFASAWVMEEGRDGSSTYAGVVRRPVNAEDIVCPYLRVGPMESQFCLTGKDACRQEERMEENMLGMLSSHKWR